MLRMPEKREASAPDFNAIRISIASPNQIEAWSWGEVLKGETINYRTQRPEKDGLFCEKIFGPTKDWECQCGKFKRQKFNGVICDRCGVEVTRARVRRERMGHIGLAAPVANIWFVKNTPSVMSLLLDLKLSDLTRVLYYSAYVVTEVDTDLVRAQLERHDSEAAALRGGACANAEGVLRELAGRIASWEREGNLADAAGAVLAMPENLRIGVEAARNGLARLNAATPDSTADYTPDIQTLGNLGRIAETAYDAVLAAGGMLLRPEDLESPERLSVLAVEGDPVARILSRFYHGDNAPSGGVAALQRRARDVIETFSDWRADPEDEEQHDEVVDAIELMEDAIVSVAEGMFLPVLDDLHGFFSSEAMRPRNPVAPEPMALHLTRLSAELANIERTVRAWNVRRGDDNPEGRGWGLPAFNALLERLHAESREVSIVPALAERVADMQTMTDPKTRSDEIGVWEESLLQVQDLLSTVGDYLQRSVAERRKEAVELVQAMRWLRWDDEQRLRPSDLEWIWDDLKLPAAGKEEAEMPDEFYIVRSGWPGLHLTTLSTSRHERLKPFWGDAFHADMGAEPILDFLKLMDQDLDQERHFTEKEMRATSAQIRTKAGKRIRLLETFRRSENRTQDMIMTVLPVLPPELRPMVQLDGGRFATSDLNDLYRRVLSRNHRLKRFLGMRAPSLMIRNEKRMLQEAVDSLIDNGRQGKPVKGKRDHELKSLSDLLKGKQGRFRQNLLGKRVDYSGRSVIVVGPELKMDECGLPKKMALELFKPFVMHRLVNNALAPNIRAAKRMVERASPEVWHILEDVIKDRPVMLNRAPTLHRLGIQAFKPVLIEGSAIQLHPLVCSAFNADFDGDQMAVHVPLSTMAVNETNSVMLSINNMLSPSSGDPLVAPNLDMVMGCYYLTEMEDEGNGSGSSKANTSDSGGHAGGGRIFYDADEARIAYADGAIGLRTPITVLYAPGAPEKLETTMGRLIFNETLPAAVGFKNELMNRRSLTNLTAELYEKLNDNQATARILDRIKELGFYYATKSGISIAINDLQVPENKESILAEAAGKVADLEESYMLGMMTEAERDDQVIRTWTNASDEMEERVRERLPNYGGVAIMANSGTKGNIAQIKQMAGMGGLMTFAGTRGEIKTFPTPVKSSFREGLSAWEYFIRTHGARRTLTDTALRTATSGYTTRRLVDVAQEVIVREYDCEFAEPYWVERYRDDNDGSAIDDRIKGRIAGDVIADPRSGEIIVERNEMITDELARAVRAAGVSSVPVRSPLTCQARRGICQLCYGRLPATGRLVEIGQAVGVIAAQSIGEPGTQLTLRTFHSGGVARGGEIVASRGRGNEEEKTGLPRVEQLFEAYVVNPNAPIVGRMAHLDGAVESVERMEDGSHQVRIINSDTDSNSQELPPGALLLVRPGEAVNEGATLAVVLDTAASAPAILSGVDPGADPGSDSDADAGASADALQLTGARVIREIRAANEGEVAIGANDITVTWREDESRTYYVPARQEPLVQAGDTVYAGQTLSTGQLPLPEVLEIRGIDGLHRYFIEEVQEVYRSQGVSIHDKHIEVILRQMLRRVEILQAGDTAFLPGDVVDKFRFQEQNELALAAGGEPATARTMLLGVSKASLTTDSFLSKASFQETTKVLTMAAVASDRDWLRGLKENVIIGRLIPARLESLLEAEHELAMREALDRFEPDMPAWLAGDVDPAAAFGILGDGALGAGAGMDVIDNELIAGQTVPAFAGGGNGDRDGGFGAEAGPGAGFQVRTAEEEDELVRRAQSLTDAESEIDREVERTASRIFSPFDDEEDDIPAL